MAVSPSDLIQTLDLYERAILQNSPKMEDPKTLLAIDKLRRMIFGHHGYAGACQIPLPPTDPAVTSCLADVPDLTAHERAAVVTLIGRRWDWWCDTVGGEEAAAGISSALSWLSMRDALDMDDSGGMPPIPHPELSGMRKVAY